MKKNATLLTVLIAFSIGTIFYLTVNLNTSPIPTPQNNNFRDTVCVYKNSELIGCEHNILFYSGQNMTRDCLTSDSCSAFTNISLCNASLGCDTPTSAGTETYSLFSGCGMDSDTGTVTYLTPEDGNWTVTKTFTSTCDGVETNATRLSNVSGSDFAGNLFSVVTLQTSDTLTINWTLSVS